MKTDIQRIALLIAALILPVVVSACGHTVSTTIDDATITTRVKTALLNEPDIAIARIEVDTFKGVVTLSGRLKSKEDEAKAIAAARKINGVTDVKSNLQIGQGPSW
jgi:osmotically-inducible protein OsmY